MTALISAPTPLLHEEMADVVVGSICRLRNVRAGGGRVVRGDGSCEAAASAALEAWLVLPANKPAPATTLPL